MIASYDAQLQIRRDAEEHSAAHRELSAWVNEMNSKRPEPKRQSADQNKGHAVPKKEHLCERLRGNNYFAEGKYEDAVQCYTRCLGQTDAPALVYSNRGNVHFVLLTCRSND